MKRAQRAHSNRTPGVTQPGNDRKGIPTVASLGLQVRLVRVGADRESEISELIAACETLRAEWERLFQRVIDLLNENDSQTRGGDGRSPPSDL